MGCGFSHQSPKKQKKLLGSRISETGNVYNPHVNLNLECLHEDNVNIGFLGSGGYSEVMLSLHLPSQQYRALKIISKDRFLLQDLSPAYRIR